MRAGDPEWMRKLREAFESTLEAAGDQRRGVNYSTSEVYLNPPADLASESDELGWTCRIVDGEVTQFSLTPHEDVDFRVEWDYSVFVTLSGLVIDGNPERQRTLEELGTDAMERGALKVQGDYRAAPSWLTSTVHDTMARLAPAS